jgi:hypothetical protein
MVLSKQIQKILNLTKIIKAKLFPDPPPLDSTYCDLLDESEVAAQCKIASSESPYYYWCDFYDRICLNLSTYLKDYKDEINNSIDIRGFQVVFGDEYSMKNFIAKLCVDYCDYNLSKSWCGEIPDVHDLEHILPLC